MFIHFCTKVYYQRAHIDHATTLVLDKQTGSPNKYKSSPGFWVPSSFVSFFVIGQFCWESLRTPPPQAPVRRRRPVAGRRFLPQAPLRAARPLRRGHPPRSGKGVIPYKAETQISTKQTKDVEVGGTRQHHVTCGLYDCMGRPRGWVRGTGASP